MAPIALPCPSEAAEQQALSRWLDVKRLLWCHVPNGGQHKVQHRAAMARLGLKSGVPDLLIFTPPPRLPACRGVAIEMKRLRGGTVSDSQRFWLEQLQAAGWQAKVCRGADEAVRWLTFLGY